MIEHNAISGRSSDAAGNKSANPIRVMIVDDSAVIRGLTSRMLNEDPEIEVTASMSNGQLAVNKITRQKFDVVVLDIEMPVMDGLTALPKLIEVDPDIKVIMSSTLTLRNAEVSLKALQAGAAEYVAKPTSTREVSSNGGGDFRRELVEKVKTLGRAARGQKRSLSAKPSSASDTRANKGPVTVPVSADIRLRKAGIHHPNILVVGSSTGGPQALFEFFKDLKPPLKMPILVTQHMPATFTTILAEHITRQTLWECTEGKEGEVIKMGHIYLAPGGYHMGVKRKGAQQVICLNQDPQENFCRPAIDPMLRSIVSVFGPRVLTVILTGMGADGMRGGRKVIEAGGTIIAQDEATSVVWGMPGAVATDGLCAAVLPLKKLAPYVTDFIG